jgi:hypothetical protein
MGYVSGSIDINDVTNYLNILFDEIDRIDNDILKTRNDLSPDIIALRAWRETVDRWIDKYPSDVDGRIKTSFDLLKKYIDNFITKDYHDMINILNRVDSDLYKKIDDLVKSVNNAIITSNNPFTFILSLKKSDNKKYIEEITALYTIIEDMYQQKYKTIPDDKKIRFGELVDIADIASDIYIV